MTLRVGIIGGGRITGLHALAYCHYPQAETPELVADAQAIRDSLGWRPRHEDLGLIVRTALDWERKIAERPNRPD